MTDKKTEIAAAEPMQLAKPQATIGIPGLENIPMSILPIPFVKLVHGTSRNVFLKDGKKANPGTFYHTDTKEVEDEINFALIQSKFQKRMVENQKTGKMELKEFLNILGYDLVSKDLFIISLSALSAWRTFGMLMAQVRKAKLTASWEFYTTLKAVVVTSNGNEFQAPEFQLGERIASEDMQKAEKAYQEYGSVLDKTIDDTADAVEVNAAPTEQGKPQEAEEIPEHQEEDAHTAPDSLDKVNPEEEVSPDDIPF